MWTSCEVLTLEFEAIPVVCRPEGFLIVLVCRLKGALGNDDTFKTRIAADMLILEYPVLSDGADEYPSNDAASEKRSVRRLWCDFSHVVSANKQRNRMVRDMEFRSWSAWSCCS